MKKIVTILAIALSINALAQIPTNGLVRHYTFSGNANDNVNSQHGTVLGATLTTDRFGTPNSAYFFDGIDDYIDLPLSGLLLNEYTYSVWVMPSSIPLANTATHIMSIGTSRVSNPNGGDQAMKVLNDNIFGWGLTGYTSNNSALVTYDAVGLAINTWNHIVAIRSSNVQKLYINCNLVSIDSLSNPIAPFYGNTPTAKIGTRQTNVEFFHGNIDDVRIYNRPLSINEIIALCEEGITSIKDQEAKQNVQIFPNPTNSTITVN